MGGVDYSPRSFNVPIEAPAEVVFDVIVEPYLGRTTRTMASKLRGLGVLLQRAIPPTSGCHQRKPGPSTPPQAPPAGRARGVSMGRSGYDTV